MYPTFLDISCESLDAKVTAPIRLDNTTHIFLVQPASYKNRGISNYDLRVDFPHPVSPTTISMLFISIKYKI